MDCCPRGYALAASDNGFLIIVEFVKHVDEIAAELKKRTQLVELIQVLDGINLLEISSSFEEPAMY